VESLKEFIEANRASKKKVSADIIERWQERVIKHGWQNEGEAGALNYLAQYGKSIAAPKCIALARQAESEGCADIAMGFWKKAYELSGGFLLEPISATPTGSRNSTIAPAPFRVALAQSHGVLTQRPAPKASSPDMDGLPPHLQPGKIVTMQPVDAPAGVSRLTYINSDRWIGMPKRDGERCVVIATPNQVWYQSRSMKIRVRPNEVIDAALKEVAFRLGAFVLDAEEVWYDMVGGEHRTGAQAQTANDQRHRPRLAPRPCLCIFKALYTTLDGDLMDAAEETRLVAVEPIFEALKRYEFQHFELVPVARTTAEKAALCLKQEQEEREGEVWIRHDTRYIGGKQRPDKSTIIRTKYQIEFTAVITDLTPSTNASLPFGAIAVSRLPDLKPVGLIGTGFDRQTMHQIAMAHEKAPGSVVIKCRTQRFTEMGQVHHAVFEELIG
jgi:bifunctional non-homologous end joining protein LigD